MSNIEIKQIKGRTPAGFLPVTSEMIKVIQDFDNLLTSTLEQVNRELMETDKSS